MIVISTMRRKNKLGRKRSCIGMVGLSDLSQFMPTVAEWLHAEFNHAKGPQLATCIAELRAQAAPEETIIRFDQDTPVATTSPVLSDLPSRPELTP